MMHGVLALLGQSLRVDARSLHIHLVRFGLLVGAYISLINLRFTMSAIFVSAPGLTLLWGIGYLNLVGMSLLGISFFSSAITEEKEEETLGLMQMAGISPAGILIGKSGSRLVQALTLLAIQYPLTLLAVTLGGVTPMQINALYLGLMAYLILLAGFGVLCSTFASNNRAAARYVVIGIAVYILAPLIVRTVAFRSVSLKGPLSLTFFILERVVGFSAFQQIGEILTTGYSDPIFSWQVIANTCVGAICFGIAWVSFRYATRNTSGEPITRGVVPGGKSRIQLFAPGRSWANPFVWKDFYFVSGGFGTVFVRLLLCVGLFWLMTEVDRTGSAISGFQVFLSLGIAVDAARIAVGSIYDERRGQTLASLVMLPRSTTGTLYSKLAGAFLVWSPAAAVDLLVSIGTEQGRTNFHALLTDPVGRMVATFFILIPHLCLVLSTFVRWGAVPLGTAIVIGLFFGLQLRVRVGDSAPYIVCIVNLCICVVCHLVLIHRFRRLAAE